MISTCISCSRSEFESLPPIYKKKNIVSIFESPEQSGDDFAFFPTIVGFKLRHIKKGIKIGIEDDN